MSEYTTVIGMDLSDKTADCCVLDARDGQVLEHVKLPMTKQAIRYKFEGMPRTLVAFETGTHSPWLQHLLESLGHYVVVAHARNLRAIYKNDRKCDKHDAEMLARLARADLNLLTPVQHRGPEVQAHLFIIKARQNLVEMRTKLVNATRGMVKSFGERLPPCSPECFAKKVKPLIPRELRPALYPTLEHIDSLTQTIRHHERSMQALCEKHYPQAQLLQSIPGVGPITALAFTLILESPDNFANTRDVGPYLGLVSRRDQSGEQDPQLRITKAGNSLLRQLLTQCAQHILSSRGQDSQLRRWGLAIAERGGKLNRKRAVTAVARKLAVVMLAMWKTNTPFCPFPGQQTQTIATSDSEAPNLESESPPSRPPKGGRRQQRPHEQTAKPAQARTGIKSRRNKSLPGEHATS